MLPSLTTVLRTALKGVTDWQARSVPPGFDPRNDLGLRTPVRLYISPLPVMYSFHLPLHRFFASVIGEGCKYPMHTPALLELQHQLAALTRDTYGKEKEKRQSGEGYLKSNDCEKEHNRTSGNNGNNSSSSSSNSSNSTKYTEESTSTNTHTQTVSYHLSGLVDYPLRSSLFGSQIRVGMWRKNGPGMTDQLLNYLDIPYCKVFRDLDVLMMQFCERTYGATRLICHILHRYGVLDHLLRDKKKGSQEKERVLKGEKYSISAGTNSQYLSSGEVLYEPSPPPPPPFSLSFSFFYTSSYPCTFSSTPICSRIQC